MQWLVITFLVSVVGIGIFISKNPEQVDQVGILDSESDVSQEDVMDYGAKESSLPVRNKLDLSGRQLEKVSSDVFEQRSLNHLDLSNNLLNGSLPAEIRQLSNLRELDLSNNQFTGVPAEIGQLQRLEVLDLSNNQLTGLPHEIGNLKNLRVLDLRGNRPSEFDLSVIEDALTETTILRD